MTWTPEHNDAMGLIEVEGVAGIIVGADAACKAAAVRLLGWESIGGFTTVFIGGSEADVAAGLKAGESAAKEIVEHVAVTVLRRPEAACGQYIGFPMEDTAEERDTALGLLETRGYGVHVAANDLMVKTADVDVTRVLTVHNRVVCTMIEGELGAVREALEAARESLSSYEHLLGAAVISQPLPQVVHLFGYAGN